MNKSKNTAFCGMISALSVVLMLVTTVLPVMMYVLPIATGILVVLTAGVTNKKWAAGTFFSTAVISLMLLTEKETALTYLFFFGWYPLVRESLSVIPKILQYLVKIVMFNFSAVAIGVVGVYVFGISKDEYTEFGKFTIPILLGMANVVFILYELMLKKYSSVLEEIAKKVRKKLK
jgi:hypothetical protein